MIYKGVLFSLVHPLVDITASVDRTFLDRYDLLPNNAILAQDKHKYIYDDLLNENYNISYSPGGSTQNTVRVVQWYLKQQYATTLVGCIGEDTFGEKIKECIAKEGVLAVYMEHSDVPTAVCIVLLTPGGNRSLVTRLNAANEFKHTHLLSPPVWSLVTDASFYYIAAYYLNTSPESMIRIGEHAVKKNKCFGMNLSAPYLTKFFAKEMKQVLPYCDIVFGNADEARALSSNFGLNSTDLGVIAEKVAAMPKKNAQRSRIVIFTQQADHIVLFKDGKVKEYPVIPIAVEDIVDTNGAGDAFVGGFLADYVQGKDVDQCVQTGTEAAHMMIQVSGCKLPESQEDILARSSESTCLAASC